MSYDEIAQWFDELSLLDELVTTPDGDVYSYSCGEIGDYLGNVNF